MSQLLANLPWLIIWVVLILLQSRFLTKKNLFGSLILLWATLLVGIFWDKALTAMAPDIDPMWLFGTPIWILFIILAARHFLALRKRDKAIPAPQPEAEPVPDEELHQAEEPEEAPLEQAPAAPQEDEEER